MAEYGAEHVAEYEVEFVAEYESEQWQSMRQSDIR